MDPQRRQREVVDIQTLTRWCDMSVPSYNVVVDNPNFKTSPFPMDDAINKKVILWCGDVTHVNTEAIVNSTNEAMNDHNVVSERILARAGPGLRKELRTVIKSCRTGEAKMTKGYNLPVRYIIHTVGPRYNLRYKTAAESALFSCYRSILQLIRENQITSIGLSCVHTQRRGYPSYEGAHIAIRTVYRFLQKYGKDIDTVVFVATGEDEVVYKSLLPLYFPRNRDEELFAAFHLPLDVGNADGEPVIAERQIRISGKPTHAPLANDLEESVNINEAFDTSIAIGAHAFSKMQGDIDKQRKQKMQRIKGTSVEYFEHQKRYERLLRRAKLVDLSEIEATHCLYHSGFDKAGRAVVIFVAHYFQAHLVDQEKALLYFVNMMDSIVKKKFVVVYLHTLSTKEQQPPLTFLKDIESLVDSRYRNNLSAIYIIHPTFWSKVLMWYFATFCVSGMKGKVQYIPGLEYLYSRVPFDQLDLPQFVSDYDQQVHGTRYYNPEEDAALGSL
ncbi:Macro domain-containing protein [Lamellibrachia satsuma]|nr:Macro domain-containing protein [Lamellibrachia satsuma]